MRILFQGDSITDGCREKRDYHHMGESYPKYASELIAARHPELDIEFVNQGISGNRTGQLFDRLYPDAIALQPDVISIMIGINDIWHRHTHMVLTTDKQIETNFEAILKTLREQTSAKIVVLAPYLLDHPDVQAMKPELESVVEIVARIGKRYADVYIPVNEYFDQALKNAPSALYYSHDGVHPNENGARFIAKYYADAIEPFLK